jgi:hypothetical protein
LSRAALPESVSSGGGVEAVGETHIREESEDDG